MGFAGRILKSGHTYRFIARTPIHRILEESKRVIQNLSSYNLYYFLKNFENLGSKNYFSELMLAAFTKKHDEFLRCDDVNLQLDFFNLIAKFYKNKSSHLEGELDQDKLISFIETVEKRVMVKSASHYLKTIFFVSFVILYNFYESKKENLAKSFLAGKFNMLIEKNIQLMQKEDDSYFSVDFLELLVVLSKGRKSYFRPRPIDIDKVLKRSNEEILKTNIHWSKLFYFKFIDLASIICLEAKNSRYNSMLLKTIEFCWVERFKYGETIDVLNHLRLLNILLCLDESQKEEKFIKDCFLAFERKLEFIKINKRKYVIMYYSILVKNSFSGLAKKIKEKYSNILENLEFNPHISDIILSGLQNKFYYEGGNLHDYSNNIINRSILHREDK